MNAYLQNLQLAIQKRDGRQLRKLFRLDSDAYLVASQLNGKPIPTGQIRAVVKEWHEIVTSYFQVLVHHSKGDRVAACDEMREKHCKLMLDCLNEEIWILPALMGATSTLREMAAQADDEVLRRGLTGGGQLQLQHCIQFCQMLFSRTVAAKGEGVEQKKSVVVEVVCIMIKIYFRLNTLSNCKTIMKNVDNQLFQISPLSHRVTYKYYTGRLSAYDENFQKADEELSYAFNNCHPAARTNKRKILRFLVPIKLLLGSLPSPELLQQYRLTEFVGICEAMRTGNVALLLRTLDTHQTTLVQAGTYLLLEKLQLSVYRRLFKKCWLVNAEANPAKQNQVPLSLFDAALRAQGMYKDDAELQCLVANLIFRKFIKGYIAYKSRIVVLAKESPFPPMHETQLSDPFASA